MFRYCQHLSVVRGEINDWFNTGEAQSELRHNVNLNLTIHSAAD